MTLERLEVGAKLAVDRMLGQLSIRLVEGHQGDGVLAEPAAAHGEVLQRDQSLPALETVGVEDVFDLVFLDAEKDDYEELFGLVRPLLEPGALVVADNVLSHAETLAGYTAARQADPTLSSVTIPLDRGLELSVVLA